MQWAINEEPKVTLQLDPKRISVCFLITLKDLENLIKWNTFPASLKHQKVTLKMFKKQTSRILFSLSPFTLDVENKIPL